MSARRRCARVALVALSLLMPARFARAQAPSARVGDTARAPWRPAAAPLFTRWAAEVSPAHPLPEYPRPQLVRERWLSLNGLWQMAAADSGEAPPLGRELPRRILVPFAVQSALSGVGEHHDRLWYRRTFRLPDAWRGERVLLHFGAVDWSAEVWLNGRRLGAHRGGYDAFSFDATDALRAGAEQELVVGVYDPTDAGGQPRGKQLVKPRGAWYTAVTGIWQTVWLEPVPAARVERLRLDPDLDASALRLSASIAGLRPGDAVRAVARARGREVGRAQGRADRELLVPVPRPHLWSPEDPFLYDLELVLLRDGRAVDSVSSYFGMRRVAVGRDARGATRVLLNGRPRFLVGPLDQGWWPDGLYTAPTDAALRSDIETMKALGFTTVRKHMKVEPARWYYWADRLGLVVWQDMPAGRNASAAVRAQFETELRAMVEQLRAHPSVIAWVPFNEGWGQYDAARIARAVEALDPTRLVDDASGWEHAGAGHVLDVHRYQAPLALRPDSAHVAIDGEFGGLGMAVPGHTWTEQGWGYAGMFTAADSLAARYAQLIGRLWRMRDTHGMSGGIYTQLTDVEREVNGLLTYDRRVVKIDTALLAAANRGELPLLLPEDRDFLDSVRVRVAQGRRTEVRYTLDGTVPTLRSPRYRGPITLRESGIVTARAFEHGRPLGPPQSARFRRAAGRAPDVVPDSVHLLPGVRFAYYESDTVRMLLRMVRGDTSAAALPPSRTGTARTLDLSPAGRRERWGVRFEGYLSVPRDGRYTFQVQANDGARLLIGDVAVVDAVAYAPAPLESDGSMVLRAGLHPIRLSYFQAFGPAALRVRIAGPGMSARPLDDVLLRHLPDAPPRQR